MNLSPAQSKTRPAFLESHQKTRERFNKAADLVEGFESSFGLELLSTVHWVVSKEQVQTVDEVVRQTYAWHDRKKKFSQHQIKLAANVLAKKGWIEPLLDEMSPS